MGQHLPVDHPLNWLYRIGSGLLGTFLTVFGVVGFATAGNRGFFTTHGHSVFGLYTNGALSAVSVIVGLVLLAGAILGGNRVATLEIGLGGLFILSGLVNLCVLRTDLNVLAFKMSNVIFSFVVGMLVLTFGLYGRVSRGEERAGQVSTGRPAGSVTA